MSGRSAWMFVVVLGCREAPTPERHEPPAAAIAEDPPLVSPTIAAPEAPPPEPRERCELVDPPPGLVDLAEVIPSAIIHAGYHRPDNFTGAPLPGYEAPGAWLEREAAAALARAAETLADQGLRLIIHDAYRPRVASEAMVAWAEANGREDLLEHGWVARRSAHGRGRAIDVGLADLDGVALDMGSAWDQFDPRSYLRGVDGPALERRLALRAAMVDAGFTPYAREWWHFGFDGDRPAPRLDRPYACR